MKVEFTSGFHKDLNALRMASLRSRIAQVIDQVIQAATSRDIPNIRKLKGHPTAYRIRVGDHRIGVFIDNGKAKFATIDHRSRIYNHFPS